MATTRAQAVEQLAKWEAALEALTTGASYSISTEAGSQSLTRNDAGQVRSMVAYWRREVEAYDHAAAGARTPSYASVAKFS